VPAAAGAGGGNSNIKSGVDRRRSPPAGPIRASIRGPIRFPGNITEGGRTTTARRAPAMRRYGNSLPGSAGGSRPPCEPARSAAPRQGLPHRSAACPSRHFVGAPAAPPGSIPACRRRLPQHRQHRQPSAAWLQPCRCFNRPAPVRQPATRLAASRAAAPPHRPARPSATTPPWSPWPGPHPRPGAPAPPAPPAPATVALGAGPRLE
jgi:hypothetical protein